MMVKILDTISPRRSLASRISLIFGLLSLTFAAVAGLIAAKVARDAAEQDVGQLFAERAQQVAQVIDDIYDQNMRGLEVGISVLGVEGFTENRGQEVAVIDAIRRNLANAILIGLADTKGRVIASDPNFKAQHVISEMPWFSRALIHPVIASDQDLHTVSGEFRDLAIVAMPLRDSGGATSGIAFAYLETGWLNNLWLHSNLDARSVELQIFNEDGIPLVTNTKARNSAEIFKLAKEALGSKPGNIQQGFLVTQDMLLGFARSSATAGIAGKDWIVAIQQPPSVAYRSANRLGLLISLSSLLLGLLLSALAAIANWFTIKKVSRIATAADSLRMGQSNEFIPLPGVDEPARISRSLAQLFNGLKAANQELADINRNLDIKVVERTRDVQRLSEETRNAAMTRERLRISRDLHDTLAHSMLAMLTQIRLMKKLLTRKPESIAEELDRAEAAAQEGLDRARKAVIELRYQAVRDDGLGQALQKLVSGLKERLEVSVSLSVDPSAVQLSGAKAETTFRIAEEALRNIEKHAGARHVSLQVRLDQSSALEHKLELLITDDGKGFDLSERKQGHFGLVGMREQADILAASLEIKSELGKGTALRLVVPM